MPPFNSTHFNNRIRNATHPEELRDILVLIFHEVVMRWTRRRVEQTGFEGVSESDLYAAFYRTVNELLIMWGNLQTQLGNTVVGFLSVLVLPLLTRS